MRKTIQARTSAFIMAFVFFMSLFLQLPFTRPTAFAEETITCEEAGMTLEASFKLNGSELVSGSNVKNGDKLEIKVDWALPTDFTYINGKFVYDLSDKLKGITLTNTVIPVPEAIYTIDNNKLYIELLAGHSGRLGYFNLNGTIDVDQNEVNGAGGFTLQFKGLLEGQEKITSVPVIVTDFVPGLVIDKNAVGNVYYDSVDNKYYQKFEIKVSSNNSASTNVTITDNGDSAYVFSGIKYFAVNGNPASPAATANGFTFNLGTVNSGYSNMQTITYSVPVDAKGCVEGTTTHKNQVTGTATDQNPVVDVAYANIASPSLTKSASYNEATKTITWTITADQGVFSDKDPNFTVTDIPGTNFTTEQLAAIKTSIAKSEFTPAGNGKYTYTYTTTLTDEQAAPPTNLTFSNTVKTTFDGINKEYSNSGSYTVPGSVKDFVEKTAGSLNPDGTVPWSIKIKVPNADVTSITVHDYTNKGSSMTMKASDFSVTGTGGTTTVASVGQINWAANDAQLTIDNASFLAANKGKDITINYNMTLPDDVTSILNTASVSMKIGSETVYDNDSEPFVKEPFKPTKFVQTNTNVYDSKFGSTVTQHKYRVLWGVKISTEQLPAVGDTFTVSDTLPTDMELIPGCYLVSSLSEDGWGYDESCNLTASQSGNNVTFSFKVTQKLLDDAVPDQWNRKPICLLYMTKLSDEGIAKLYSDSSDKTYTNTATVSRNGIPVGTTTAEKTITPPLSDVVTKDCNLESGKGDYSSNAIYTVVINKEKVDLSKTDTVTAVDTLGSNLKLIGEPKIEPSTGASYSKNGNTLTFNLKDNTTYTITYEVEINRITKDDADSYSSDQLNSMFGNSIFVDVEGASNFSDSAMISSGHYAVDAGYTNKEQNANITISGKKIWKNDNTSVRPDKITIKLTEYITYTNGKTETNTITKTVKPDANDEWTYKFENLPTLMTDGTKITYEITEVTSEGYEVSYSDNAKNFINQTIGTNKQYSLDITNTYTSTTTPTEKITVSGTKTWVDNNDAAGARPSSIIVNLLADGTSIDSKTVTAADNWTYTFTDLEKYDTDGNEISYSVSENKITDYTGVVSGYNITNHYTPAPAPIEKVTVSGTKTWDDNNNAAGARPESITVNLLADGTSIDYKTVTAADNWTYTFTDLDKFDTDGNEISYSVSENKVTDYTATLSGYDITNHYTPAPAPIPKITVSGTKTWNDNNDAAGVRPSSIIVNLLANGTTVDSRTVSAATNWTYTFEELNKCDTDGNDIVYSVSEIEIPDYTATISGYDITNTYTPAPAPIEKVTVSGTKTWDDNNNAAGVRPSSITVKLLANGTTVASKDVTAADSWTYTFTDFDKFDTEGNEITYTISEVEVDMYKGAYEGYNITNTYSPAPAEVEKTSVSGTKIWVDNNNADNTRPESIIVNLLANGTTVESKTVTAADNWTYTFTELDKYDPLGNEITYVVSENKIADYKGTFSGYDITNTYKPAPAEAEKVTVSGTKTWVDNNNADGARPTNITVNLLANGTTVDSKIVSAADNWVYTFNNLDKYDPLGNEITYTVSENKIADYKGTFSGYNITNTYTPVSVGTGKTSISVQKVWDDNNNSLGDRPSSITVKLWADGTAVDTAVLSELNGWKHTFTDLDKTNGNAPINYTVDEGYVANYTSTVTGSAANGFVITNTHNTLPSSDTVSVKVTKIWDDNNNYMYMRPQSLTVTLYRNGMAYQTVTYDWTKFGNTWTYTFDNLPKYVNGTNVEYVYSVNEENLTEIGYTGTVTGNNYDFTIVNKFTPDDYFFPDPPKEPEDTQDEPEDIASGEGIEAERDETNNTPIIVAIAAFTAASGIIINVRRKKNQK